MSMEPAKFRSLRPMLIDTSFQYKKNSSRDIHSKIREIVLIRLRCTILLPEYILSWVFKTRANHDKRIADSNLADRIT